jgi:uncharacterized OB-fold protein
MESAGRGTVYTYTVVHRAPSTAFSVPYVLAAIDLEEGFTMFSNVVRCPPEEVTFDMPVTVVFEERAPGLILPVFVPARA